MPIVEPILQQRRERHDRELTKRSAGGCDTKGDRAFLGGVCRLIEPKIGPNPAAAMPIPHNTFPSVSMTPSVANPITNMPMTYKTPPAATVRAVPKRSATLPTNGENAPISSTARALANDHTSRPTLRSAAIGF